MKVKFVYQIMHNENNLYTVSKYRNLETNKVITCRGYHLPDKSITYDFELKEVVDKKYGRQYEVLSYSECIESNRESIVEYLSCGIIKGIGIRTAERIFDQFGTDSIDILDKHPKELLMIRGITENKLKRIVSSYQENAKYRDVGEFLIPFGFSVKQVNHICKSMKESTLSEIKKKPYSICSISGFSFQMAERLREVLNIDLFDIERIYAAAMETVKDNMSHGAVGITKEQLIVGMNKLLALPLPAREQDSYIWKKVIHFIHTERLSYRKILKDDRVYQYIYLPEIEKMERELAKLIVSHAKNIITPVQDIDRLIERFSEGILFDESQRKAIRNAFTYGLSIITGPPGSGKTTTAMMISKIQKYLDGEVSQEFMAPTGRAARKITENTFEIARTIHSRLKLGVSSSEGMVFGDEEEEITESLVLVDEFSMVDMKLAHKLFSSIKTSRIVLVGDIHQLLSVGPGNVLRDMIESGIIPVTVLKYIHRQDENSMIWENADNMQRGIATFKEADDFHVIDIEKMHPEVMHNQMLMMQELENAMTKAVVDKASLYGIDNVVCICPYRKYSAGVYSMNNRLQEALNPLNGRIEMFGLNGMSFRVGDAVMHLRNTEEALNGDVGIVKDICEQDGELSMKVLYKDECGRDRILTYSKDDMEDITLAYAMTVHKCQGSEYKAVVGCLTDFHGMMKTRAVLYTMITRAREDVTLFTSKNVISEAIQNDRVEQRNTLLAYDLVTEYGNDYEQLKLAL